MGHELRRPLREAIPPGLLTKSERYLLLEIADLANDKTRVAKFGSKKVAPLVGMTPEAVRKHVQRMSRKGIELRVPLCTGEDGRPVYAHDGRETNYQIPADLVARLKELDGQSVHPLKPSEGGQRVQALTPEGGQNGPRGWTKERERVDNTSTPTPQVSPKNTSKTSSSSGAVGMIRAACDANEEEAEEIVSLIRSKTEVNSWSRYIKTIAASGDLAAKLADVRAARSRSNDNNPRPTPWCGQCSDHIVRQVPNPNGPGVLRCPTCHPRRHEPVNSRRRADPTTRHIDPMTPEQRHARSPFVNAVRASDLGSPTSWPNRSNSAADDTNDKEFQT